MIGAQTHFPDLCPVRAKRPPKPARARRNPALPDPTRYGGTASDQVLAFVKDTGSWGATDEEMQVQLAMNPSTQRPRRIEWVQAGQVKASGRTRKTAAGVVAIVWVHKDVQVVTQ